MRGACHAGLISRAPVPPFIVPRPPSRSLSSSLSLSPPCEQWLAGLGWGAGLSFVRASPPSLPSPPLHVVALWCGDVAVSTHDPPREQWLAGLGRVLGCRSWRGVRGVAFVHASHPPFPLVIPPAIHPMGSCSWGWGRVVRHQ